MMYEQMRKAGISDKKIREVAKQWEGENIKIILPPSSLTPQQTRTRKLILAIAILLGIVLTGGIYHAAANIGLFIFRQGGTGATTDDAPTDQQFITSQVHPSPTPNSRPVPQHP